MKITRVVETDNGAAEFTAELSPEQVQFLLGIGINLLIQKGVHLFADKDKVVVPGSNSQP